jgi:hypothetical protein
MIDYAFSIDKSPHGEKGSKGIIVLDPSCSIQSPNLREEKIEAPKGPFLLQD